MSQVQQLLNLSRRAFSGAKQTNIRAELDAYNTALHAYCQTKPGYVKNQIKGSDQIAFDQTYYRPFPTVTECFDIQNAAIGMAIVYFCRILSSGFEDPGKAERNDKAFRDEHLDSIVGVLFADPDKKAEFFELCDQLLTARDQMLGHADAAAFEITHGEQLGWMNLYSKSWESIDIEYWESTLEPLRIQILKYEQANTRR